MKHFVVIADLHAHPWAAFSRGDGLHNSRLQHTLRVLEASLKYAQEEDIPWLFIGDLVHTAGYALNTVLAGVVEVLARYHGVPKIVVWGNHDARGVGGKISVEQTVFASLVYQVPLTLLDPTVTPIVECNGLTISGAGYQPSPELLEYGVPADIGLYHQTIRGSAAPNNFIFDEGIDPQELLARHRLAIVGHVHHPQQMDAPDKQAILIPGSPEHHNFGDRGEHGWWVISLPTAQGNPQAMFMPGGSPEFRTVDTPSEVENDGNYYRVRTMPKGATLPHMAQAIAPSPTTVKHRDLLHGEVTLEQVLQLWLKTKPPTTNGTNTKEYFAVGRSLLHQTQEPIRVRDVRLAELTLENFCSFENETLTVKPGMWLVMGTGRDYPSNGSGKTTLVGEALYWLLFGRTTKGLGADEVIRWGAKTASVTAVLHDVDGTSLVITRTKGRHSTLEVVPQGAPPWEATSVNEMTEKLGRYLGLTPEIYQNLAYFSQERLLLFSSATDGERKGVLADLIGLNAYQEASSKASSYVTDLERELEGQDTKEEVLQSQLAGAQTELTATQERGAAWGTHHGQTLDAALRELERVRSNPRLEHIQRGIIALPQRVGALLSTYTARREAERDELAAEIREQLLAELEGRRAEVQEKIQWVQTGLLNEFPTVEAARKSISCLSTVRNEHEQSTEKLKALQDHETQAVLNESLQAGQVKLFKTEWEQLKQEHQEAKQALSEGTCPTCGQVVDDSHRERCLRPFLARQEEMVPRGQKEVEELRKATSASKQAQHNVAQEQGRFNKLDALLRQLTPLEPYLSKFDIHQQQLASLQQVDESIVQKRTAEALARLIEQYRDKQAVRLRRAQEFAATRLREQAQVITQHEKEIGRLHKEDNPHIAEAQRITTRLDELQAQVKEVTKAREEVQRHIPIYDYWRQGFSKQGLQSLLVEEIASLFNANRSEVFTLLTQGIYDVQFSTLSQTKSGELRERTEFFITEHGQPIPYGALSGGQRRRIDIGIMLVLAQVVAQWMQTAGIFGVLILDEVFGFLDASGAEGLLGALAQVNERIPTIYVVTHDVHLQSLFPNIIHVQQDEVGTSRIARSWPPQ